MKKYITLLTITLSTLGCCLKSNTEKTKITQNEDVYCPELKEIEIDIYLDKSKSNMEFLSYLLNSYSSEFETVKIDSEQELETYFRNKWEKNSDYFSFITGKDYVITECKKRIQNKINFENDNLIIVNGNFGGPPFNSIKCDLKNNNLEFIEIDRQNPDRISGMALRPFCKMFAVPKKIKLKV